MSADGPTLIVRCAGRRPMRLRPGERLRIGRHASNDLVLADDTVSRFHAVIQWDPDEDRPFVQDNGSANGVDVDGECIELRSHLPGGNQVQIGKFTLTCEVTGVDRRHHVASAGAAPRDATPANQAAMLDESDSVVLFSEKKVDIRGDAASATELQRLFLDLEEQQRTGTLSIRAGDVKGRITFCVGQVMSAQWGPQNGLEALRDVILLDGSSYSFSRELRPVEDPLKLSVRRFISSELAELTRKLKGPVKPTVRSQPVFFDDRPALPGGPITDDDMPSLD